MPPPKTDLQILNIARDLLASEGIGAVSFDAIALRLGRTKQAVLYWYPTKHDLLSALFLPWLESEAEVAARSVADASGHREAVSAFVRAIAAFHFEDLDRFRMMYLVPQTLKQSASEPRHADLLEKVHPVTDRVYAALAMHLEGGPATARRQAVAIHSAVLGLVLMFSLAESLGDPLKHAAPEMVDALIASLGAV